MPCYTVSTATVELGKNTDTTLLELAMRQLGVYVSSYVFDSSTGKLTIPDRFGIDLATVKRAYSEQVILATAKKNGWQVSWQTSSAGNRVAQVERISR